MGEKKWFFIIQPSSSNINFFFTISNSRIGRIREEERKMILLFKKISFSFLIKFQKGNTK